MPSKRKWRPRWPRRKRRSTCQPVIEMTFTAGGSQGRSLFFPHRPPPSEERINVRGRQQESCNCSRRCLKRSRQMVGAPLRSPDSAARCPYLHVDMMDCDSVQLPRALLPPMARARTHTSCPGTSPASTNPPRLRGQGCVHPRRPAVQARLHLYALALTTGCSRNSACVVPCSSGRRWMCISGADVRVVLTGR